MGVRGEAREIIQNAKSGLSYDPSDHKSLVNSVIKLVQKTESERNSMGKNGKNYYNKNMALDVAIEKYKDVFKKLL